MLSPNGQFVSTTSSRSGKRGFTAVSVRDGATLGRLEWSTTPSTASVSRIPAAFSQNDVVVKTKIAGQKKIVEKAYPAGEFFAVCEPTPIYDIMVCNSHSLSLDWAVKMPAKSVIVQVLLINATKLLVLLEDGGCFVAVKPVETKGKTSVLAEGEQVVPRAAGGAGCDVGSLAGPLGALFHTYVDAQPTEVYAAAKGDSKIVAVELNSSGQGFLILTHGGQVKRAVLGATLTLSSDVTSSPSPSTSQLVRCQVPCAYWIAAASNSAPKGKNSCSLGYILRVATKVSSAPTAVEVEWSALNSALKSANNATIQNVSVTSCEVMSTNMACFGLVATTGPNTSCAMLVYATFFEGNDSNLAVDTSVVMGSQLDDTQQASIVCTRFDAESSIHTIVREVKKVSSTGVTEMAICHASTLHGAPRGRLHWQSTSALGGSDDAAVTFNYPLLAPSGAVRLTIAVTSSVARQTDTVSQWPNSVLGFVQLVRQSVDASSIERLLIPFHPSLIRNGLRKAGSSTMTSKSTVSVSNLFHLVVSKLQEKSVLNTSGVSFLHVCGGAMEIATQLLTLKNQLGAEVSQDDLALFVSLLRSVRPLGLESLASASRLSMVLRAAEAQMKLEEQEKQLQDEKDNIVSGAPIQKAKRRAAKHVAMHTKIAPTGAGEVAEAVRAHSAGLEKELAKMELLLVTPPTAAAGVKRALFMGVGGRRTDTAQDRYEAAISATTTTA